MLKRWVTWSDRPSYVLAILVVVSIKATVVTLISLVLRNVDLSTTFFVAQHPSSPSWLLPFYSWDSGWYTGLVYQKSCLQCFAFFPLYPLLIKYLGAMIGDPVLAGFLISNILGIAWLPFFQSVANRHMGRFEALSCTIIAASFPYVLLFSMALYSESLFLFSTVLAWYLYLRGRLVAASLAAGVATLTKPYGIAILIPILTDAGFRRKWREMLVGLIPATLLFAWIGYQYVTVGSFAFISAEYSGTWNVEHPIWWLISPVLTGRPTEYFMRNIATLGNWAMSYWTGVLSIPYILAVVMLFGLLALRVWSVDWRLGLYSTSLLGGLLMVAPIDSLPRYFSFIFPLWLTVPARDRISLPLLIVFFSVFSIALWYQFIMGWVV